MENKKERIYSLDLLKFGLAILIAIWHLNQMFGVTFPLSKFIFEQIRLDGAVDTFFIISGFLCLYNYSNQSYDSYISKKIKRLYPLAILSVIVSVILMIIYKIVFDTDFFGINLGIWTIFNSILLTHTGGAVYIDVAINNPLWYVSVLMICYSLFWLITKDGKDNKKYLLLLACLIGLGIYEYKINLPFINAYTGRGCAGFFLGTYICYLYTNYKKQMDSNVFLMVIISILAMIVGLLVYDYSYFMDNKWCVDTFIISPLIIVSFINLNRFLTKLSKLSILSNLSYSIYVWHDVILIVYCFFKKGTCSFLEMIIFVFVVVLFGLFSNLFIEKRLNKIIYKKG